MRVRGLALVSSRRRAKPSSSASRRLRCLVIARPSGAIPSLIDVTVIIFHIWDRNVVVAADI